MRYGIIFIALFSLHSAFGQRGQIEQFPKEETAIIAAHAKISRNASQEDNMRNNAALLSLLDSILHIPETFFYPFSDLPFGNVIAPDNAFRIFSWNMLHDNGEYENFAFIQLNPRGEREFKVYRLHDKRSEIRNPGNAVGNPDKWFGAGYYSIIGVKRSNEVLYTLLGWNPNNLLTQQKVIEILRFRGNSIEFGAPLLEVRGRGLQRRVIFEYSARVSMLLRFETQKRMIVFEHLAPSSPHYEGLYEHYGPDGSYDAYGYGNNRWQFYSDIDVRNPRSGFKDYLPSFLRNIFYPDRTFDY